MSDVRGEVGKRKIAFKSVPHGPVGVAQIEVDGVTFDVSWRMDREGIWIETPRGVFGFDLRKEIDDERRSVYEVAQRESANQWAGVNFSRGGEREIQAGDSTKKKTVRVRAQMPGKIIRMGVTQGSQVEKDQSLLVMEAMKMENEIRAPQAGKIMKINVNAGQAVETGADLILIEPL